MKIGESIYSGASIINGNINNRYGCFQFNVSNGTGILEGVSVFQMILESSGISLLAFKNGYWKTIWSTALKSDLSAYATNAQLQSTFINISNKRYVKITASENNSNYGIIFAVTSQGILCVYSVNGNFTTLFESTGNRVKISASGLVTTIDCAASYTHGFILRGGSLKNMPYEIS